MLAKGWALLTDLAGKSRVFWWLMHNAKVKAPLKHVCWPGPHMHFKKNKGLPRTVLEGDGCLVQYRAFCYIPEKDERLGPRFWELWSPEMLLF